MPVEAPSANAQDDTKAPAGTPDDHTQDKGKETTDTSAENPKSDTATAQNNDENHARFVDITIYHVISENRICIDPAPGAYEKMDAQTKAMFGCHSQKTEYTRYCEPTDTQCKTNLSRTNRRAKIEDLGTFKYRITSKYVVAGYDNRIKDIHFRMNIEKACQVKDATNCFCKVAQVTDFSFDESNPENIALISNYYNETYLNHPVDCAKAENSG